MNYVREVEYAIASLTQYYPAATLPQLQEATAFWVPTDSPNFAQIQLDRAAVNLRKLRGAKR